MKTILMTNAYIKDYTGSEIDTVTIAKHFIKKGYNVDIFTLEKAYPLLYDIDKRIRVLDYSENNLLYNHYDYIWAHHYPLLDYILFEKKIKADYIHYVSLSSYENFEAYPDYYKNLSLVSVLSKEAKLKNLEEGYDVENINIFPNYVELDTLVNTYKPDNVLRKICIVSNHVPQELEDIKKYFEKENISVKIYGKNHTYQLITPELLCEYDLLISIGKTINLALAIGIPCFVYDRFGGDGYILSSNIKKSFEYNFSGRYIGKKYSAVELVEKIKLGYNDCIKETNECQKFAQDNFVLENIIEKAIELMQKKVMNYDEFYTNYKHLFRKAPLFIRESGRRQAEIDGNKIYLQIYYSNDGKYNENNSIKVYMRNNRFVFNMPTSIKYKKYRIDLSNEEGYKINDLIINEKKIDDLTNMKHSGLICMNKEFVSIDNDPWIELENIESLEISYTIKSISKDFITHYIDSIEKLNDLTTSIKYVKGFINPKLYILLSKENLPENIVFKNAYQENVKVTYYKNIQEKLVLEIPFKTKSISCYYYNNGEKLLFKYSCSRIQKLKEKLLIRK